jgi:hypothetical protein
VLYHYYSWFSSQPTVGPISDLQLLAAVDDEASDMDLSEVLSFARTVRLDL